MFSEFSGQAILHYDPKNLDEDPQFISKHLDAMVSMLLEEQMMLEGDIETGQLLECFMEWKVMKNLVEMAEHNTPPGMNRWALQALSRIVQHMKPLFLALTPVHKALVALIDIGATTEKLERKEFLNLLSQIILKLKEEPSLISLFFQSVPSAKDSTTESKEFVIFKALKRQYLTKSEFFLIGSRTNSSLVHLLHRCILSCLQFEDTDVEEYINKSKFVDVVVGDLVSLYNSLPTQLTSNNLRMDEYIKHIHFINSTSKFCHNTTFTAQLISLIEKKFFEDVLVPELLSPDPEKANLHTIYLRETLIQIDSPFILQSFINFLLGNFSEPETKLHPDQTQLLRYILISRINDLSVDDPTNRMLSTTDMNVATSTQNANNPLGETETNKRNNNVNYTISPGEQLAISTIKLFYTLLDYYNEQVFTNLIGRNYTKEMCNAIESAEKIKLENFLEVHPMLNRETDVNHYIEYAKQSVVLAKRHVNRWLTHQKTERGEDNLKLTNEPFEGLNNAFSVFSIFVNRSLKVEQCLLMTKGTFLEALFRGLENLYDHSLDYALFLTGVIGKLAHLPHPFLHKFLCSAFKDDISLQQKGLHSLYSILQKLCQPIAQSLKNNPEEYTQLFETTKEELSNGFKL